MSIPKVLGETFDQTLKALRDPTLEVALLEVVGDEGQNLYAVCLVNSKSGDDGETEHSVSPVALLPYYTPKDGADFMEISMLIDGVKPENNRMSRPIPPGLVEEFETPEEIACSLDDFDEDFDDE